MAHTVSSIFDEVMKKINESPFYVRELILFAPAGLLAGFAAKNFGRTFLIIVASVVASFWLASYLGLIDFDVAQLKALLGISQLASGADVYDFVVARIHEHVLGCIVFAVSVFIGWKLGA